jgi:ferredoxin-NADP reductase
LTSPGSRSPLTVRVTEARFEAAQVRSLVLRRTSGVALPPWEPGAHIDLLLPDGTARQYSLCGDPQNERAYRIGVRLEPEGRGGSRWLHQGLGVGDVVQIRPPRNHFRLEAAPGYTFLAGGIGITPILPMVRHVQRGAAPWRLVYAGRDRATMAFLDEVTALGERAQVVPTDETGRADLPSLLGGMGPEDLLYVCGPSSMVEAVQQDAAAAGCSERIRYELFSAPVTDEPEGDVGPPFEVELSRSRLTIMVPPTSTILREVRAAGIRVLSDCEDGICGSCETAIVEGHADHRDHVLTLEEQRSGTIMMICVSRCHGERLVLDL